MIKLSTQPSLTSAQKVSLREWLVNTLQHEKLENSRLFPLDSKLAIYTLNGPKTVSRGSWEKGEYSSNIILAGHSDLVEPSERLAILCTLSQYCDESVELQDAARGAITRYLLGEYQGLSSQLVSSVVPPKGIAFSTDNRVASLFDSGWMLPSGENVNVSGSEWTVCASELPVELPHPTREFRVGDRVSYTEIPSIGPRVGEGVITQTGEDLRVRDTSGNLWLFTNYENLLTIESVTVVEETPAVDVDFNASNFEPAFPPVTATEFAVGQRVHWNDPDEYDNQSGDGVIEAGESYDRNYLRVRIDSQTTYNLAFPSELTALE